MIDNVDTISNKQILLDQNLLLTQLHNTSNLDSKITEIYFESKVLELIYSVVSDINESSNTSNIYLSEKDIECLKRAKKMLIENIHNPPSLKNLALKSAINEFKLKKGFKQLFGNTVYGFLQEYRLNEAKKLLESNDINISEAALFVGYKNVSHFSTAFKKHFGYSPINIRKKYKKLFI